VNQYPWHWTEGKVNREKPHFLLLYGDLNKVKTKNLISVALLSRHVGCKLHVEFIMDENQGEYEVIREAVEREINFYVIELKERNPLAYLSYHCTTASNFYSKVHWVRPKISKSY
jgi:hypothetical protein